MVPAQYGDQFTDFGDGGPEGLAVTRIFLDQALPLLGNNAEFIIYSVLAVNDQSQVLLHEEFRRRRGLSVQANFLNIRDLNLEARNYANAFSSYLSDHGHSVNAEDFAAALRANHIARMQAQIIRIRPRAGATVISQGQSPLTVLEEAYNRNRARFDTDEGLGGSILQVEFRPTTPTN